MKTKPTLTLIPEQKGVALNDLFGIFFEDLNHAADGGLYAEMVQNRSFEFDSIDNPLYNNLTSWVDEHGQPLSFHPLELRIMDAEPLNCNNTHYLKIDVNEQLIIQNVGFNNGMNFRAGESYNFSLLHV